MSYQVNPCTPWVMPSSSLQRPQTKLGCSLRRLNSKRLLVSSRKLITHQLSGVKGHLTGLKKVPTCSKGSNCFSCHRQHHSCGLHKQRGRYEVRFTLCPSTATPVLVQTETYCPEGQTHSRLSECDWGQAVPPRSDNPDGMVPSTGDIKLTGRKYPCTLLQAFCLKTIWRRRAHSVWPQWSSQLWPLLWINP